MFIDHLLDYNFLILTLILAIPGGIIYIFKRELRLPIHRMSIISIPFAFTESFFYPEYWEPRFLGDAIFILGFGLEDIFFVMGLSWIATTSYPAIFNKIYQIKKNLIQVSLIFQLLIFFLVVGLCIFLLQYSSIPMIYGSFAIMILVGLLMGFMRKDLIIPGAIGGFLCMSVYSLICIILIAIYPAIFEMTWHTENFTNVFLFGIPVEEILYSYGAGFSATIFYPFIYGLEFISKNSKN